MEGDGDVVADQLFHPCINRCDHAADCRLFQGVECQVASLLGIIDKGDSIGSSEVREETILILEESDLIGLDHKGDILDDGDEIESDLYVIDIISKGISESNFFIDGK